ncbi:MAG: hypothetical protein KME26_15980 [Oscillatoria princeps RMCB-10]|nr:hypothetical protein [Oscillatoria princeps RMCB-10]
MQLSVAELVRRLALTGHLGLGFGIWDLGLKKPPRGEGVGGGEGVAVNPPEAILQRRKLIM